VLCKDARRERGCQRLKSVGLRVELEVWGREQEKPGVRDGGRWGGDKHHVANIWTHARRWGKGDGEGRGGVSKATGTGRKVAAQTLSLPSHAHPHTPHPRFYNAPPRPTCPPRERTSFSNAVQSRQ
jgi:hypothetical protein